MLIPAKGFETPAEQACGELYCKAEPRSQQVSMLSSQGAMCADRRRIKAEAVLFCKPVMPRI